MLSGTEATHHHQSLDDIVSSNDKANRRRSVPVYAANQMAMGSPDSRRFSSMNFGAPANQTMNDFQFDMTAGIESMLPTATFPRTTGELQNDRIPAADLAINTHFSQPNPNSPFPNVANGGSAYASPLQHDGALDMDMSPYPTALSMSLDMNDPMSMLPGDASMFPNPTFGPAMMGSPIAQDFAGPQASTPQDHTMAMQPRDSYRSESSSVTPNARSNMPARTISQDQKSMRSEARPRNESRSNSHQPCDSLTMN